MLIASLTFAAATVLVTTFVGIAMAAAASAKLLAVLFLVAFLLPMIPPMPRKPKMPEPTWLRMSRKHAHS